MTTNTTAAAVPAHVAKANAHLATFIADITDADVLCVLAMNHPRTTHLAGVGDALQFRLDGHKYVVAFDAACAVSSVTMDGRRAAKTAAHAVLCAE